MKILISRKSNAADKILSLLRSAVSDGTLVEIPPLALVGINVHGAGDLVPVRLNPGFVIMTSCRSLATIALSVCLLVQFFQSGEAYRPLNHACCVKYTRRPLPFRLIKGYVVQSSLEVCRIDAIIFVTMKNHKVCASPEDDWVKTAIFCLSEKIDGMTNSGEVDDPLNRECRALKMVNGSTT
ncbi:C-C motif chemokine 20 [Brienomyrus brachyistius]|uniref:C-C motif chemokine 20 n=1 Tax=Brienomyrus brachyistius TaxID=42636 RepID=UPI0020B27991|nr:C-C motif chemokine 20 [Brienomyrus brachyistius]